MGQTADKPLFQLFQRPGAVAQRILNSRIQFSESLRVAIRDKQWIVAEPPLPFRRKINLPFACPLE